MEANNTNVSCQEIADMIMMETIMVISALINIEIFVLKPSWMTAVSELILLRISPVLLLSKNPTSLLIRKKNRSYLRFFEID